MATVTASSYAVSRSACLNRHGRTDAAAKVNSVTLGGHALVYDGLRSLNKLHVRSARAVKGLSSTARGKVSGEVVCGMNLVFVGAEVGPWSKTGGLGDVLGGLPPALAVSRFHQFGLSLFCHLFLLYHYGKCLV